MHCVEVLQGFRDTVALCNTSLQQYHKYISSDGEFDRPLDASC